MISLDHVSKRYGSTTVVDDLTLDIADGELCVLVGPSGCGKSTTLKMVNRLVEPSAGTIRVAGDDVMSVPAVELRRRIGYVIQHVGLFPHLTIAANVATVPRLLGWPQARIDARAAELLELVGLDPARYARRYPNELSGGQRQRVGVARALAADPPVLLMDEPFGAIDPITRARLQQEFRRLQGELRKTVVFVTHDVDEAVLLGDRIAVLREGGLLEQYDVPAAVLARPATDFVAAFVGADRGLKRLSVTAIDLEALVGAPALRGFERLGDARRSIAEAGTGFAVVVDDDGRPTGWLADSACAGAGRVADRTSGAPPTVPADATLKDAFTQLLGHDVGWVAVVDGDRYLGVLTTDSVHQTLRRPVATN